MLRSSGPAPPRRDEPAAWWPVVGLVALLAASNLATNRLLPDWAYLPWGIALTLILVGVAARDGCRPADLGLGRSDLWRGLAWGAAAMAAIVVVYLVALALPATREAFDDARVRDTTGWGLAFQAGVRIPFGTVVPEEVAFRGVLLAMAARRMGTARAVALSSGLFGLWHVLPSMGFESTNPLLDGAVGPVLVTVGSVAATAVAGVAFCWLRLRSGSLLAPMMLHLGTNSTGFALSWLYLEVLSS